MEFRRVGIPKFWERNMNFQWGEGLMEKREKKKSSGGGEMEKNVILNILKFSGKAQSSMVAIVRLFLFQLLH